MFLGCIRSNDYEDKLTLGKMYKLEHEYENAYAIFCDDGGYSSFPKSRFMKFSDEQAPLFDEYRNQAKIASEAERKKSEIFQQLLDTGLNRGQVVYMTGKLNGLK